VPGGGRPSAAATPIYPAGSVVLELHLDVDDWQTLAARHQGDWIAAARELVHHFHKAGAFKRLRPTQNGETDMKINAAMRKHALAKGWIQDGASDDDIRKVLAAKLTSGELTGEAWALLLRDQEPDARSVLRDVIREEMGGGRSGGPTPSQVFGVRSGAPSGRYSRVRSVAKHQKTGAEVMLNGAPVLSPSQAETALAGAYVKRLLRRSGTPVRWDEHDEELWRELVNDHPWTSFAGEDATVVPGGERVKALLDDAVSGGSAINPVILDDMVLSTLILSGELAPFTDIRDVPRGRIVRTGLMSRPTATWGTPDSTPATLFDTTNLIGSTDTTIFDLKGAVEVGNDLASDTSVNVGEMLQAGFRETMAASLDTVCATGDGVSQPLGLANTSGLVSVASVNGATGPVTVADLEALIFALGKPYRAAMNGPCFVGSDVNYRRFRTIPTATGANERVWGMGTGDNEQQYQLAGYPFRVANSLPNTKLLFVALKRYRLYRRLGVITRVESGGRELALRNVSLILAYARYGGRLYDPLAGAVIANLPA
jgi:HK97 family phage major capsid protein